MADTQFAPEVDVIGPVNTAISTIKDVFAPVFDLISTVTEGMVEGVEFLLIGPPAVVVLLVLAGIAWLVRSWQFAVGTALAFLLIDAMGFWVETMESLALTGVSAAIAIVIGLPIGILAARNKAVRAAVRPVLDFMQTMPAFVYLIPAVLFFAVGKVPGVFATLIFAMPPAVRLTELGIREVDAEVVEASEAFGARPWQVLRQVQIPLAMPTIMAGINQVIMLALSMVVIAGLAGAGGLGALVVRGITRLNIGLGFASGLAVVILAVYLDRLTAALGPAERST